MKECERVWKLSEALSIHDCRLSMLTHQPRIAPTFDGGAHLGREGRERRADGGLFDKAHHRVVGRQARGPERGG